MGRRSKTKAQLLQHVEQDIQLASGSGAESTLSAQAVVLQRSPSTVRTRSASENEGEKSRFTRHKAAKRSRYADRQTPQLLRLNDPTLSRLPNDDVPSASTSSLSDGYHTRLSTTQTQTQTQLFSPTEQSSAAPLNSVDIIFWSTADPALQSRPPEHIDVDTMTTRTSQSSNLALRPPRIEVQSQDTDSHLPPPIVYRPQLQFASSLADQVPYGQNFGPAFHSAPNPAAGPESHTQTNASQSARRTWPQHSPDLSSLTAYPAPPPSLSSAQISTLSEQQRPSNFGPPAPAQQFGYGQSVGGAAGSVGNNQYENSAMMDVGSYPTLGTGQGPLNTLQQRVHQQQSSQPQSQFQQTSQFHQQPPQSHHHAAGPYDYQSGRRGDFDGLATHPSERWQSGQRSDQTDINTVSGQSSTSSDWRSLPTLRLQQQLRSVHGDNLASSSQSESSSEKTGKRHMSRARLQTHLRHLQAEMVDLKERVRVAENLYRESSPVDGPSFSETSAGRMMNPSFGRMASSDDLEMQDYRARERSSLPTGAESSSMATMMEGIPNLMASSPKPPFVPPGARRPNPYGTGSTSTLSASTSSALGRRGTWRSGEDGKTLVFNSGGAPAEPFSSQPQQEASVESGHISRTADREEEEEQDELKDASADLSSVTEGPEAGKRYQCLVSGCLKTFTTSGHARRHSRTHLGHKLFVCPHEGCGSTFTRRDNCRQHQRARHQRTLPVYEMTEADTLEYLILDRQQEQQQQRHYVPPPPSQHQQQQHVMYDPRAGPSSHHPR